MTSIISKPFPANIASTIPGRAMSKYIFYTETVGEVKGNRLVPAGNLETTEVNLWSKIPELQYQSLSLSNPDLVKKLNDKTYLANYGILINNQLNPTAIAPDNIQRNADNLQSSVVASAQETIKSNQLEDGSNLSPNVANTQESTGDLASQGTPTQERKRDTSPLITFEYPQVKKEKDVALLYYPLNIADGQDKIEFSVWQYNKRTINNPQGTIPSLGFSKNEYVSVNEPKVFLPISNKIMDSNAVNWSEDSMNELQRQLANISLSATGVPTALEKPEEAAEKFLGFMGSNAFGNLARTWLAGQAVGVNGLLTRATGATINPNLELLFQNPLLRAFQFQFLLIGKSEKESEVIKKIIRFFKKNMAVRTDGMETISETGTPAFLNSPYVFGIRYLKGQTEHPSINKIKKCALQNFSVDYTPMNSYMTYTDGSMFAYSLSMQFKELTPIYDIDYTDNHQIGY